MLEHAVVGKQPTLSPRSTAKREPLPPTVIGAGTIVSTGAIVFAGSTIGERVILGDQSCVRERVTIGDDVVVGRGSLVENDTSIGAMTKIQADAYITAYSTLEEHVFIAPCVVTTNDNWMGRTDKRFGNIKGPTIRRGARIGGGAILCPAIEIGEDAFVGAGAVVTKDVPPRVVVVGSPARVLRDVPEDELLDPRRLGRGSSAGCRRRAQLERGSSNASRQVPGGGSQRPRPAPDPPGAPVLAISTRRCGVAVACAAGSPVRVARPAQELRFCADHGAHREAISADRRRRDGRVRADDAGINGACYRDAEEYQPAASVAGDLAARKPASTGRGRTARDVAASLPRHGSTARVTPAATSSAASAPLLSVSTSAAVSGTSAAAASARVRRDDA